MSKKDTQPLKVLIQRSRLLTDDRKEKLLGHVSSMSPKAQEKLENILYEEGKFLSGFVEHTIGQAINSGNTEVLKQLDGFFFKAGMKLRKTEESAERAQETEQMEHLLDDIST